MSSWFYSYFIFDRSLDTWLPDINSANGMTYPDSAELHILASLYFKYILIVSSAFEFLQKYSIPFC